MYIHITINSIILVYTSGLYTYCIYLTLYLYTHKIIQCNGIHAVCFPIYTVIEYMIIYILYQ